MLAAQLEELHRKLAPQIILYQPLKVYPAFLCNGLCNSLEFTLLHGRSNVLIYHGSLKNFLPARKESKLFQRLDCLDYSIVILNDNIYYWILVTNILPNAEFYLKMTIESIQNSVLLIKYHSFYG